MDLLAWTDVVRVEPLGIRLDGVLERSRRDVYRFGHWLHLAHVDDRPIRGQPGDGQRDRGIAHPESDLGRPREREEHSLVSSEIGTKHQPLLPLFLGGGHLEIQANPIDDEVAVGRWLVALVVPLSRRGGYEEYSKHKGDEGPAELAQRPPRDPEQRV